MPTYQYACTSCGERLEAVQKFSDDPLTVCPRCEGKLRKLFSPVGVVFKGSGFYKTDSRSSGSKSSGSNSGSGGSTAGSDSSSGSSSSSSGSESSSGGSSGETGGDKPSSGGDKPSSSGDKVA
jgi:putative FmdB family regulatory protein